MKKIAITASGGGHTGYAVALAQRLKGKVDMDFIVPEGDEWTISKVSKYGSIIPIRKARGPKDPLIKAVPGLLKAAMQSFRKISSRYSTLICTGSNHSVPPAFAGKIKGLKVLAIESCVRFTKPSKSIKMLRLISNAVILQWPEQKDFYPDGLVVGPLYEEPEYEPWDGGYILVTGGTYGFKELFDALNELDLDNVVLQVGQVELKPYTSKHPRWTVFDFDPNFNRWIAGARVVVSHFGKTCIDAALTYNKPVIIAVNPSWRFTVGWEDARILADKLNAVLLEELTPDALLNAINEALKRKPPRYEDGAARLAEMIINELC